MTKGSSSRLLQIAIAWGEGEVGSLEEGGVGLVRWVAWREGGGGIKKFV